MQNLTFGPSQLTKLHMQSSPIKLHVLILTIKKLELKTYIVYYVQDRLAGHSNSAVKRFVLQVLLLIDIQLSYINTNHEDFIGFAK